MRLSLCLLCLVLSCVVGDELEVSLKQGRLRGRRLTTRKGREYLAFSGIPYAKPPIGDLRFKRSLPAEGWEGVRDATKDSEECIQIDVYLQQKEVKGQEDCLYINVYTPKIEKDAKLPVMFWIHGGGWLSGSGSSFLYGGNYLLDKDIVLVTFNYRLGPLGFLSTGDEVCPGNNGLKDQVLALQWVQDNIAQFSGNPDRVTVFGQSAGGASSHYHVMSPMSKGLLHGAISHSGVPLAPWAFASPEVATGVGRKLGTLLNCPTQSSAEMVECLREKTAKEIIETDKEFREWNMHPVIPFRPVRESGEDAFITNDPIGLLQDPASVANIPFMAGLTSGDGAIAVASIFHSPKLLKEFSNNFDSLAPLMMFYRETSPDPDYVTERIKKFYFEDLAITNETRYHVVDLMTDAMSTFSIDESVRLQATTVAAPVFYYYFDYKGEASYTTIYGDPTGLDYGVCHGDELQYLFPQAALLNMEKLNEKDSKMVDTLTTLWTDFARTGNPTPAGHAHAHWNAVKTSEVEYLHIGRDGEIKMSHSLLAQRTHFWATLPLTNHPYTSIRDEL